MAPLGMSEYQSNLPTFARLGPPDPTTSLSYCRWWAVAHVHFTPVILAFGGHDSLCFSQVVENKALPCLPSKWFMGLTI